MLNWYYKLRIGTLYVTIAPKVYVRVNIFGGNCLCAFTQWTKDKESGKTLETLISFYLDEGHLRRCVKGGMKACPCNGVTKVRLNTYFSEAMILAKYFAKEGLKVELYYKEI